LELFGVENDSLFGFIGVGYVNDPHEILMVLFDDLTFFFHYFTFSELLVGRYHFLQVDVQDSSRHSGYLEFVHSLIAFEVYFYILGEVEFGFLLFVVHKSIVEKDRLFRKKSVVFILEMLDEFVSVIFF
jgi:hypothetical protein